MTRVAFMTFSDWAGDGSAMAESGEQIRAWLGEQRWLFVVNDTKKYASHDTVDEMVVESIAGGPAEYLTDFGKLHSLLSVELTSTFAVAALNPFGESDAQRLRRLVESSSAERVFVLVWHSSELVYHWLHSVSATDLGTGTASPAPDPLLICAAREMVDREYNGLSHGRGKDAVVQLLRAFSEEGYPLEEGPWLRAYFAAGGQFRHAGAIATLLGEMNRGVRHRVKPAFRPEIVRILRQRLSGDSGDN